MTTNDTVNTSPMHPPLPYRVPRTGKLRHTQQRGTHETTTLENEKRGHSGQREPSGNEGSSVVHETHTRQRRARQRKQRDTRSAQRKIAELLSAIEKTPPPALSPPHTTGRGWRTGLPPSPPKDGTKMSGIRSVPLLHSDGIGIGARSAGAGG